MTDPAAPVAAILLAAGNSERMGSPKPLLQLRGETFLQRQVKLYQGAGCAVHIVLGREAERIAAACPEAAGAALLLNPQPERGMISSLQIGLAALPAATPAVFFTPIDNPGVQPATLAAMLRAWREFTPPLVIPRLDGRRGHPVLLDGRLISGLLAWPASSTAKEFIHGHLEGAAWADVDDPNIALDIDTPADYQRFLREGSQ